MPRKRQISSTPEEMSADEEDELSDVPSDVGLEQMEDDEGEMNDAEGGEGDVEDEEEEEGEEEEVEEEEEEEGEDNEAEGDEDYDQQSEEDRDAASSEDEEAESDVAVLPAKPAPTTSRGGRVLRKQEPAPPQRAPYRSSRLAKAPPSDEEEDEEDDEGEEDEEEEDEEEQDEDEDEEDSDEVPTIPAITTTSKGRVSRKPVQLLQEMSTNQPTSRSSRRAAPPPAPPPPPPLQPHLDRPKIKLKISLGRDTPQQQVPMEEIKVESPPKVMKPLPKATKPEPKPPTVSRVATRTTKPPEIVVEPDEEEEEEEESSSSVLEEEEEEEDISEMMDEDDLLPGGGTEMDLDEEEEEEDEDEELTERSRTGTPMDPTRMTKRQQAKYDEALRPHSLMSLPNETLRKRALTAEEIALRRSETARRRKNQSEQRLEEEKIETINRLLKPQAPRRRGAAARAESPTGGGPSDTELGGGTREPTPPPPPTKVRTVVDAGGTRVAIPERWMAAFQVAAPRGVRTLEGCGRCGKTGIYPVKTGGRACSLGCIKALQAGG